MPFDAFKRHDDPGIPALALGMVDIQIKRRRTWPTRAMRKIEITLWIALWLSVLVAILVLR